VDGFAYGRVAESDRVFALPMRAVAVKCLDRNFILECNEIIRPVSEDRLIHFRATKLERYLRNR
jgi:hypothetical protein